MKKSLTIGDPSTVAVILPATGAEVSALSVVMDVLGGPLSGGLTAIIKMFDLGDAPSEDCATAHFFLAINIASLTSVENFKATVDPRSI